MQTPYLSNISVNYNEIDEILHSPAQMEDCKMDLDKETTTASKISATASKTASTTAEAKTKNTTTLGRSRKKKAAPQPPTTSTVNKVNYF